MSVTSSAADLLAGLVPTPLLAAYAAFMGASVASFLGVVAERVPAGASISGRSQCICGRQLCAADMVPVLSWLAMGGRARCCKSQIPVRYVITEAAMGASTAFLVAGPLPVVVAAAGVALTCAALLVSTWGR